MTDELQQDDGSVPGEDLIVKLAAVGGGIYLLGNVLSRGFQNEEARRFRDRASTIADDIEAELENPGDFTDADHLTHAETYKNMVQATNTNLPNDSACHVDVATWEAEAAGEPPETRAMVWKTVAHQQAMCRLGEVADRGAFRNFYNGLPDWLKNYLKIGVSVAGAAALIAVINRLIDFGRRGGGGVLDLLGDMVDLARNAVYGQPDMIEEIETAPAPGEQPAPSGPPSGAPQVSGTPRGAWEILGVPASYLVTILDALGIPASVVITVAPQAVELIVDVTGPGLTMEDTRTVWGAAAVLALALAISAAVVLAAADGPSPVGDAAGAALLAGVAAAIGLQIDMDRVWEIAGTVQDNTVGT